MKTINEEFGRMMQLLIFAVLWVALLAIEGHLEFSKKAFLTLPHVFTIYTILVVIFMKWAWRWRCFRGWLVDLPDLEGKWEGEILSTWKNPETGEKRGSVKAELTIHQTYSTITCFVRTDESESESAAALLAKNESSDAVRLSYVYLNRPLAAVKNRSEIHDGAATLVLKDEDGLELTGQYWTSRQSTGDMKFRRLSR